MAERFSTTLYNFEAYLDVQKNLSPRTRQAYVYDLERFANFIIAKQGRMPSPAKISKADIVEYLEHLQMKRGLKSTTLSRTIASLRVFYEFCATNGIVTVNPTQHLHNPKNPKKLPIFLTDMELATLFEAPDRATPLGARDYAILVALAFTGMRLSELVGLNLADLHLERRTIKVLGKGAKERIIPLNEMVASAISQYLEVRPASPDPAIFLNRFNKRLGGRGVENVVKKCVLQTGIANIKISPHKLRHTFATLLHLKDVDLLEIQALMGHASITSTQIYTHTNPGRLRSAVEKLDDF